jgi:hypothetical protein
MVHLGHAVILLFTSMYNLNSFYGGFGPVFCVGKYSTQIVTYVGNQSLLISALNP